jgi:hypothetical protein
MERAGARGWSSRYAIDWHAIVSTKGSLERKENIHKYKEFQINFIFRKKWPIFIVKLKHNEMKILLFTLTNLDTNSYRLNNLKLSPYF